VHSDDEGRRWSHRGRVGGTPAALALRDGTLFVSLSDGAVERSDDGGRSWTVVLATP
jgi:photosystem II stability/assembly factor-like uncharacterized protein